MTQRHYNLYHTARAFIHVVLVLNGKDYLYFSDQDFMARTMLNNLEAKKKKDYDKLKEARLKMSDNYYHHIDLVVSLETFLHLLEATNMSYSERVYARHKISLYFLRQQP